MSNAKERKFKKTNRALWEALDRLKKGQPISSELKERKKLKVNNYAVEIEAGLSIGVLKNHPDVKKAIKVYQDQLALTEHGLSDYEDVAQYKIKEIRERLKKETEQKKQYVTELDRVNISMKNELAAHHEVVVAMFNKVPLSEREPLMRNVDNIVPLHKINGNPPS